MSFLLPLGAVAYPLLSQAAEPRDDYERQGWTRVWEDEFDAAAVNTDDWVVLNRQDSFNDEKQYYREEQVSITDGKLRLTAVDQPLANKAYRSGLVRTHEEWSYGRFEVRADLPTGQGMWPAIWLLPRNVDWPTGGEIDIMENRGSQPTLTSSAYHWQEDPNIPCCGARQFVFDEYTATNPDNSPVNFHEGFHDYAVEWERDILRFYVDGNRHFTITSRTGTIFDTAKSLILNLAVGGDFGGDPDGSTSFPQNFDIEYARVWQRENGFFGLVNGGFDEDGGSLTDWDTFNDVGGALSITTANSLTGGAAFRLAAEAGGASFAGIYQGVRVEGGETLRARAETLIPTGDAFAIGSSASLKVEFYSQFGGNFGSASYLGQEFITIADSGTPSGDWLHNEFLVDTPINAVEARLTLIVEEGAAPSGAVLIDALSLVSVDPLLGDYNDDGLVDAADYTVWRDTYGSTNNLAADGDRNGVVDDADRGVWLANFGRTAGGAVSVPEPAAVGLVLIGLLAPTGQRRSR